MVKISVIFGYTNCQGIIKNLHDTYLKQEIHREVFQDGVNDAIQKLKVKLSHQQKEQRAFNAKLLAASKAKQKKKIKKPRNKKKNSDNDKKDELEKKLGKMERLLIAIKKKVYHDSSAVYRDIETNNGSINLPTTPESDGKVQYGVVIIIYQHLIAFSDKY